MRVSGILGASLIPTVFAIDSTVYQDGETGFKFSTYNAAYTLGRSVTFRIAVPSAVPSNTPYDAVLQVVAPNEVGWVGLSWGGRMNGVPLTVSWVNGNAAVVSSRRATNYNMPATYTGATYQILKGGTKSNGTHWQYTAKCSGCTTWIGTTGSTTTLNAGGANTLAFAYSSIKPSSPSSSSSTLSVHDVHTSWSHDFSAAANSNFSALVARNS